MTVFHKLIFFRQQHTNHDRQADSKGYEDIFVQKSGRIIQFGRQKQKQHIVDLPTPLCEQIQPLQQLAFGTFCCHQNLQFRIQTENLWQAIVHHLGDKTDHCEHGKHPGTPEVQRDEIQAVQEKQEEPRAS